MLVDCPKCGFNQPQDRYCAKCGVDMENFSPKQPPLWARLADRPAFHVGMAALLAVLLFSWIYVSQREDIDAKIRQAFTEETAPAPQATTPPPPPPPPQENRAMRLAGEAEEQTLTMRAAPPSPAAEEEAEPAAAAAPETLRVSYAEVPRPLVRLWAEEGQVLNETANTRSILLPGVGSPLQYARDEWNLFRLPGAQSLPLQPEEIIRLNHFRREPDGTGEIGFGLEIIPDEVSSTGITFDTQMVVTLPSPMGDDLTTTTTTGRFTIPPAHTLVILGGLPQQSVRGEAAKIFMNTPLQILQSAEYLSGASEFAIFIQPQ